MLKATLLNARTRLTTQQKPVPPGDFSTKRTVFCRHQTNACRLPPYEAKNHVIYELTCRFELRVNVMNPKMNLRHRGRKKIIPPAKRLESMRPLVQ